MALPITWKNVAQPRTASANALLMAGYKATSNAPMVGGQILKDASERIKGENTEDGVSMASQLNNLDTFGSDRRGLMEQFLNKNVNEAVLSKALDTRQQFLQDNAQFANDQVISDFTIANQDAVLASKLAREAAAINSSRVQANTSRERMDMELTDYAYAHSPEGLTAAKAIRDEEFKNKKTLQFLKNSKGDGTGLDKILDTGEDWNVWDFIPFANDVDETYNRVNKLRIMYKGLPNLDKIIANNTNKNKRIKSFNKLEKDIKRAAVNAQLVTGTVYGLPPE